MNIEIDLGPLSARLFVLKEGNAKVAAYQVTNTKNTVKYSVGPIPHG